MSGTNNTQLAPEESVQVHDASRVIITNGDGGAGEYLLQQANVPSAVKKIEVASTQTIVVAADAIKITNIGSTRLTIGWEGRSQSSQ